MVGDRAKRWGSGQSPFPCSPPTTATWSVPTVGCKWYKPFDESIRVPLLVKGPGVVQTPSGISTPTSHVDLIPTLMGLAGIEVERAAAGAAEHHDEARRSPVGT